MIDKRSPKKTTKQKAEKKFKLLSLESWIFIICIRTFCTMLKSSHENKSYTHNDFYLNVILHKKKLHEKS